MFLRRALRVSDQIGARIEVNSLRRVLVLQPCRFESAFAKAARRERVPQDESAVSSATATTTTTTNAAQDSKPMTEINAVGDLQLSKLLTNNLAAMDIVTLLEVQKQVIPVALAGEDVIAKSHTGSGKTLSYLIPIAQHLMQNVKLSNHREGSGVSAVVVSPTRELAQQIFDEASTLLAGSKYGVRLLTSGMNDRGMDMYRFGKRNDLIVCTPGRFLREVLHVSQLRRMLQSVKMVVLDEADRLLEIGFRKELDEILQTLPPPSERQMMLLSATFPPNVTKIASQDMKSTAVFIDAKTEDHQVVPKNLTQSVRVCESHDAVANLKAILEAELASKEGKVIVFFNTVCMTAHMATLFSHVLDMNVIPMHSRLSANQRASSWKRFQTKSRAVLFTSDVSARGMDYENVTLVVQFGVASSREQFIHRLGRTARAGKEGRAVLLLTAQERPFLKRIDDLAINHDAPIAADALERHKADIATVGSELRKQDAYQLEESLAKAYQAMLGFYNSMRGEFGWSKDALLSFTGSLVTAVGATTTPTISPHVLAKLGLHESRPRSFENQYGDRKFGSRPSSFSRRPYSDSDRQAGGERRANSPFGSINRGAPSARKEES